MNLQLQPVSLDDIEPATWDEHLGADHPFLRHAFLRALESAEVTTGDNGWLPFHQRLSDDDGFQAYLPLFLKGHSHGEFTFDWGWAHAFEQSVGPYYPKLYCGAPFTPAKGPRVIGPAVTYANATRALIELARQTRLSSVHVAYPDDALATTLRDHGFLTRKDWQFHWHNRDYGDFEAFLGALKIRKRKNIRRERRLVLEQGYSFRRVFGADASSDDLAFAARMYQNTFFEKGNWATLTQDFFSTVAQQLPEQTLFIIADRAGEPRACAIFFIGDRTLYGRYWGTSEDTAMLHFETCYYQGIEFAIENGLKRFEPGAQGTHKIARGFVPVANECLHYFCHRGFHRAVQEQLGDQEAALDARYQAQLEQLWPYRER